MMNQTQKKILGYILLPQVMPRVREFFASGFSHFAFYIALVYRAARLLPAGHPYLSYSNIGRFGIRHVVAEAASKLEWRREKADQIAIFGLILVGLVILLLQGGLLLLGAFSQVAYAGGADLPGSYAEFFVTQNPSHDIAFVLLDRVFGVPNLFESCVTTNQPCYNNAQADLPYPLHNALHGILQFYSIGLLVVAVIIFLYFIMAILAETAQTGTPFGKRFNHVWAPVRMVVALGLLIPMGSGLNAAQYITLYAAKWGSGFATNGWLLFLDRAVTGEQTLLGERQRLVASPNPPAVNELVVFFSTVATCLNGERDLYNRTNLNAYLINPNVTSGARLLSNTSYEYARDTYYGQTPRGAGNARGRFESTKILIYFGEWSQSQATAGGATGSGGGENFPRRVQNVEPTCGAISLEITDVDTDGSPGSQYINEQYYNLLASLWEAASGGGGGGAGGSMGTVLQQIGRSIWLRSSPLDNANPRAPLPDFEARRNTITDYRSYINDAIQEAVEQQRTSDRWLEDSRALGWAGAAIWYNQVATLNGSLVSAAYNQPVIVRYPDAMEHVQSKRIGASQILQTRDRFRPVQPGGEPVPMRREHEEKLAEALYNTLLQWEEVGGRSSGNLLIDMVQSVFGLEGLFDMASNTDIHPLAQLVGIGKSLVNRSIMGLLDSMGGFLVSSVARAVDWHLISTAASAIGSFQGSIAMMGLGVGFVLFYVVPFLPFIYFFFAVGTWIKAIFEAMVGVPLWALAHIRIDGNGLPGDAAMGGYFMILEIFLRPIMIIFALLGSITLFAAQVRVLHEIWQMVVSNVAGFDREAAANVATGLTGAIEWMRYPIDQFFYTLIYAVIVYMLGMASFKLVDVLPREVMRWMGASANYFNDRAGEEAGNILRNSMMSSNLVASQMKAAGQGIGSSVTNAIDGIKGIK